MDEILKPLLQSDLLTESVKRDIQANWIKAVETKTQMIREEVELEVKARLSEQFTKDRDALVEAVDTFIGNQLKSELSELKEDIERFRDLEVEAAKKISAEKSKMSKTLKSEMEELTEAIDQFLEQRLSEEIEELTEDIAIVKKNEFGRRVVEAFAQEFNMHFVDEDSTQSKLKLAESKLRDANRKIALMEKKESKAARQDKLNSVLSNLTGSKREQMEFMLENVETEKLQAVYDQYIGRILKEDTQVPNKKTSLIDGNGDKRVLNESKKTSGADDFLTHLKRYGGI